MNFPTLYAKDKQGKIKEWNIGVVGSTITVTHGKMGGKMQEQVTVITEGKNIGKANETTPEEQALSEAQSKWNKQVKKDYRERVEDIPASTLPPLAKKFQDASTALGDEYDVLVKLDGVRCTMFYSKEGVIFQSRGGESYPVIQEIANELHKQVWSHTPNMVVDGELYCHDLHLEEITSAVKKHNEDTDKIEFYVFDIHDPSEPDKVWEDRQEFYTILISPTDRLKTVSCMTVSSEEEMLELHDRYVAEGYEGVVCRRRGSKFVFGHRTSDFQKYKVAKDEEFEVVRFEVDKNGCAIPWCRIDNTVDPSRNEFKAPLVGTREYQQEIAQNQDKYIGKYLKVVFEAYSKYGIPAKPKGHVFREVDEDGNPIE